MTMERQREGLAIQKTPREDTEDTVVTWRSPRQALPLNGDTMEDTKMTDCQSHQHQHDRLSLPMTLTIMQRHDNGETQRRLGHPEDNYKVRD
jgi:hypothetical protein